MAEPDAKERMRRLEERIAKARLTHDPPPRQTQDHHSQAHVAWRMVIELVTGLVIGFGIGYGLDVLFGTQPIMLVLFTLLGFAAGVRVMLRTAEELNVANRADSAAGAADKEEDDERG
ncbi:F0F1 ATP synthase subunit I [Rhodobacteraceae bacterium WD3A24]|nr:F0F1 ATP synthase subunit I [Rhodobacteraceae bacterium WD3A24]